MGRLLGMLQLVTLVLTLTVAPALLLGLFLYLVPAVRSHPLYLPALHAMGSTLIILPLAMFLLNLFNLGRGRFLSLNNYFHFDGFFIAFPAFFLGIICRNIHLKSIIHVLIFLAVMIIGMGLIYSYDRITKKRSKKEH